MLNWPTNVFYTKKKRKKIKLAFYSVLPPAGKMEKPLKG